MSVDEIAVATTGKILGGIQQFLSGDVSGMERTLLDLPQGNGSVIHRFAPGLYIRELSVAAGCIISGHFQRYSNFNVFLKGKVLIILPTGETKELTAPMQFTAPPGKKFGIVLEDMVWQNIYATDETDIATLEQMFLEPSETSLHDKWMRLWAESIRREEDRKDYLTTIESLGYTPEQVQEESERTEDRIPFPLGSYKVKIDESGIQGHGLFATADIVMGEEIAPARLDGKRTPAGRYTNHAEFPNAAFRVSPKGDLFLVAIANIPGCSGGRNGAEITVDYKQTFMAARGLPHHALLPTGDTLCPQQS